MLKALLILGGAVMLVCCGGAGSHGGSEVKRTQEHVVTEASRNLKINMSENGRLSYTFEAPAVEGYTLASEPYRVFREGIKITTYTSDSIPRQNGVLTANYALYYEKRELWEVVGDVVLSRSDGKIMTSEQLFWNAQTERIYSNVDTRLEDRSTGDVYDGEGFESDESMDEWSFRRLKGRMSVDELDRSRQSAESKDDKSADKGE